MNKENPDNFIQKIGEIKLSDTSRARMRQELSTYADFHSSPSPVRKTEDGRFIWQEGHSSSHIALFAYTKRHMTLIASLMIAVVFGGGTSFAAERAVPGDTLYPVKIEVNERVRSAFAISAESEAKLAARLAERRLAEAEKLMNEDRFDAEKSSDLSARIDAHINQANDATLRMDANGDTAAAAEVRARLSGSLDAHTAIFSSLYADMGDGNSQEFLTDLRARANAAAQAEAQMRVETDYSAEATEAAVVRAEMVVREVRAAFNRATHLSAEAKARIEVRVQAAESAAVDARAAFEAEAYARAHESVREAVRIAYEVHTLLTSSSRIQVDINLSGNGQTDPTPYVPGDEPVSDDETSGGVQVDTDINVNGNGVDSSLRGNLQIR